MVTPFHLKAAYADHFPGTPEWVRAPGRINLIGEHLDYNLGYVFPVAIDKTMWLGMTASEGAEIEMVAADLGETGRFAPGDVDDRAPGWLKYLQALVKEAQIAGLNIPGIQGLIGGNIPVGAGLSSSAAMGAGVIYWLYHHNGMAIDRMAIARIAQAAEHRIGVKCGIMDQFAVLHGKTGQAVRLDCRDMSYEYAPLNLSDYILVLINTHVSHTLADTGYNDRRATCESVLKYLQSQVDGIESLRDVTADMLQTHAGTIGETGIARVSYVLEEHQRVIKATSALRNGDFELLGQLLYASHTGLSEQYEVSCEELDLLIELAKKEKLPGARMVGGGFGGCTLNLIERDRWEAVIERMTEAYQKETGIEASVYAVVADEGVSLLAE